MIGFRKRSAAGHPARRASIWVASTVLASVIGVLVTVNIDSSREWLSARQPLRAQVSVSPEYPAGGYALLVPDPDRLPADIAAVDDCARMWTVGRAAGGIPVWPSAHRVVLRGVATNGVTIVDMRAKITHRAPAADGALLECPSAGAADPVGLAFDLTSSDAAPAQRVDEKAEYSGELVDQFADGFVITVAEHESVPLMVQTTLPSDAVWWHIEADVLVGGQLRTIVVDNDGEDFYSPGRRRDNQYLEGHRAGVDTTDWGVDQGTELVAGPDRPSALRIGAVLLPYLPGLDIYRPADREATDDESGSAQRWVRHQGRKLLSFNPAGAPALQLPAQGDLCGSSDWYGDDYDDPGYGYLRTRTVVSSQQREHGGQQFEHWTIDYRCSIPGEGMSRDGESGTASYWECGGVRCPEQTYRLQAARMLGSDILFVSLSSETAEQDRDLAARLLAGVRIAGRR